MFYSDFCYALLAVHPAVPLLSVNSVANRPTAAAAARSEEDAMLETGTVALALAALPLSRALHQTRMQLYSLSCLY
jgi:hypothetical protein